jgi:hypothetical protein
MLYPVPGVIVNILLDPELTETAVAGEIVPPVPAVGVIVKLLSAKVALMVWLAVTLVKVYVATAPTDTPSTRTFAMPYPAPGDMVKV